MPLCLYGLCALDESTVTARKQQAVTVAALHVTTHLWHTKTRSVNHGVAYQAKLLEHATLLQKSLAQSCVMLTWIVCV